MSKPILYLKIYEINQLRGEYFHHAGEFSIGTDLRSDHCSQMEGLPSRLSLVVPAGKEFILRFPETATGSLTRDRSTTEISDLLTHGFIGVKNGLVQLQLKRGQYGSIQWASLTIEFDFRHDTAYFAADLERINRERKRQKLANQTVFNKSERLFKIILILSLLIHAGWGIFTFLTKLPPPKIVTVKEMPKRFAKLVLEPPPSVKKPKPVPVPGQTTQPGSVGGDQQGKGDPEGQPDGEKGSADQASGAKGGGDGQTAGGSPEGKRDVRTMGVLGLITSQGGGGSFGGGTGNLQAAGMARSLDASFGLSGSGSGGGAGTGTGEGGGFPFVTSYGDGEYGDVVSKDVVEDKVASVNLQRVGTVTFDNPSQIEGDAASSAFRTAAAIRRAIMTQMEGVRYCFNQSLKQNSSLYGKVVMIFTIQANGSVINVDVSESTLNDTDLESCVTEVVKRWRFQPIATGEVEVIYPLVFTPKG